MASPLKAIPTPALKHNMAIKQIEKGCELTAMLRAHLGILKDATDSPFGNIFEEISHTLALSRDILTRSDHRNLLGSKLVTSQASGGAEIHKRKRDDKFKDSQRRRYNNKKTKYTTMPDHDGYQWRKYGQKNILSKIHPRSYYRCTYHKDRSCMAAKQVQQCNDENPPLFEVNYFEEHTCNIPSMSSSRYTINEKILDFSGKSIPESNLSANAMGRRRQDEDAALVSCLTNVITGYNSRMSERSNGGPKALNTSIESSLLINDDISSIENSLLTEDEFPVVHDITMDLEWLEHEHPVPFGDFAPNLEAFHENGWFTL